MNTAKDGMNVVVIGLGYVGLVTGLGLAKLGHRVTGIDIVPQRLQALRQGRVPFVEPGLDKILSEVLRKKRFQATSDLAAVVQADVLFVCVGTPSQPDGAIDLSGLRKALQDISPLCQTACREQVIVIRSTVIPGTTESFVLPLLQEVARARRHRLGLVVNPEFLREGQALKDFMQPDRIVLGAQDLRDLDKLMTLYAPLEATVLRTQPATAEMIKYTSNVLLATLISFSNEIARICESLPGVDVKHVLKGVHLDRRLATRINGKNISAGIVEYLVAGCGFGGSCLPKDLRALLALAKERGVQTQLLDAVKAVNDAQPAHMVNIAESLMGDLRGKRTLVLGLSFKDGVDDTRESIGIALSKTLMQRGAQVSVYDPLVQSRHVEALMQSGARYVKDAASAFRRCDVCFITTASPRFRFIEKELASVPRNGESPLVVDGRGLIETRNSHAANFYAAIGSGRAGSRKATSRPLEAVVL